MGQGNYTSLGTLQLLQLDHLQATELVVSRDCRASNSKGVSAKQEAAAKASVLLFIMRV